MAWPKTSPITLLACQSPAERVEALSQNNPISGFDFQEADDALEPLNVGDDVKVVQQLVVVEVLCL